VTVKVKLQMIRGLVESLLGEAGRTMLRFYESHALTLGLIIVAYGVLMYLSWTTLVRIYRYLVVAAAVELGQERERRSGGPKKASTLPSLPWQAAVDSVRFPLVSREAGLLPIRKSVHAVQSIVDERELLQHALAVANGADPRRIAPTYRLARPRQVEKHGKN
jgi:hypothetical protein